MAETKDQVHADLRGLLDEVGMDVAVGLRAVIAAGRIAGWRYGTEPDETKCVLGTAAYLLAGQVGFPVRGCCWRWAPRYGALEDYALPIDPGDVPDAAGAEGPSCAAMLVSWIDEWVAEASDVRG